MADNEDLRAAQTPMRDLLENVAAELESGWRAHSEPRDHMASHQWGDEVSREVGRIIREALSRYRAGGEALTLADLRRANVERQSYWGGSDNWTLADWSNALAGEVGEACNVVKKIRRPQLGTVGNDADLPKYHDQLETEIGDVLIYLDLLAKAAGFTLDTCVSRAFNEKSEKLSMPVRLEPLSRDTESGWREVCVAASMPGTTGFTMAAFNAAEVPVGTPVFVRATPPTVEPRRDANGNVIPWAQQHDYFMAFDPENPDVPLD